MIATSVKQLLIVNQILIVSAIENREQRGEDVPWLCRVEGYSRRPKIIPCLATRES